MDYYGRDTKNYGCEYHLLVLLCTRAHVVTTIGLELLELRFLVKINHAAHVSSPTHIHIGSRSVNLNRTALRTAGRSRQPPQTNCLLSILSTFD